MNPHVFPVCTAQDILNRTPDNRPWIWKGFLRPGAITLFSSPPRMGKSTLVSLLLDRMANGGTLAGQPVKAGKVFVASEESDDEWAPRIRKLNLLGHTRFSQKPFPLKPNMNAFYEYFKAMLAHKADLYVIDSLQHFLPPYTEDSTAGIRKVVPIISMLLRNQAGVWLIHQPNKSDRGDFNFTGSIALQANANIMMELRQPLDARPLERRRRLQVKSRFDPKPWVMVELNEEGTDYTVLEEKPIEDAYDRGWKALQIVLEDADRQLTITNVLEQWPQDHDLPSLRTLNRLLERATADKVIVRLGEGRKHSPFLYSLPGRTFESDTLPVGFEPIVLEPPSLPTVPEPPASSDSKAA